MHKHAERMKLYTEDAFNHDKPWELWEFLGPNKEWEDCKDHPEWRENTLYRRRPKIEVIKALDGYGYNVRFEGNVVCNLVFKPSDDLAREIVKEYKNN